MNNKDCYTLGDLKKYLAECTLPDDTPIVVERLSVEGPDGGHDVETMALESIGENDGRVISFVGYEDSLDNDDLEFICGDA